MTRTKEEIKAIRKNGKPNNSEYNGNNFLDFVIYKKVSYENYKKRIYKA